jgi:hypothetical protein
MGGSIGDFAAQQASGQGTDIVSQLSQGGDFNKALSFGTDALGVTDEVSQGVELASRALEPAADIAGAVGKYAGPVGAAASVALSAASGNYGKAAVDLALYGIGMAFGPVGMMASLITTLLPDEWMDDIYGLFS